MKNTKSVFLIIFLGLMTLIYFSCERTSPNSLRIVSINDDSPLILDAKDWYLVSVDTTEDPPESTFSYLVKDWIVPINVSYIETGIGLPTYPTPYTARLTSYTVMFREVDPTSLWRPNNVNGAVNIEIVGDPEGEPVRINLNLIPNEWIQLYIDTLAPTGEDEPEVASGPMVKATIILTGYEELTRNPVVDTGYMTINFGDYYDNPAVRESK